jgi:hypothetical protein
MYWCLIEDGEMVGVFALGSVFDKPKSVKQYMEQYSFQSNEIANNIVYCLHGQKDKNAGSKFLSLCRLDAISWWHERYGDELKAFETFILPPRNGAVYKADNWQQIGMTAGNAQKVKTIPKELAETYSNVREQKFKDGRTMYLITERVPTEKKIILMRLVTDKDRRKAMTNTYYGTQCECHFLLDKQMALF